MDSASRTYPIKSLITCNTIGVVYVLECNCGLQYIGRASRPLSVHIAEHFNNIKKGLRTHNFSKHFRNFHNRDPKFWGLERVNKHWRGGNFIRHLSQRESFWIHETQVLAQGGSNVKFDLNCFISNKRDLAFFFVVVYIYVTFNFYYR